MSHGISFYGRDTNMLNDSSIRAIMRKYGGPFVIAVIDAIFEMIYGVDGHSLQWIDEDDETLGAIAEKICAFGEEEKILNVRDALIRKKVFDERIFSDYKILTSRRIQETYVRAVASMKRTADIPKEIDVLNKVSGNLPRTFQKLSGTFQETSGNIPENSKNIPRTFQETSGNIPENSSVNKIKENTNQLTKSAEVFLEKIQESAESIPEPEQEEPQQAKPFLRETVVKILVKPNDFTVDRQLIDIATNAITAGTAGMNLEAVKRISRRADQECALYESSGGRSGKKHRWQTIANELQARFKTAGLTFPTRFSGINEPPPESPARAAVPQRIRTTPEQEEVTEEFFNLAKKSVISDVDPAGETIEETRSRLKCDMATAYRERSSWKTIRTYNLQTLGGNQ